MGRSLFVYLSVCLSVGVSTRCDWSSLPAEAIRQHISYKDTAGGYAALPCEFTAGGRAGFLYPTNLPPEAKREYPMSGTA
jgi:hypothetical protein